MLHHRPNLPRPLPPFRNYRDVTRSVASLVRPKQNLNGSEWSRKYLNYDFGALPWHAEVLNALTDPLTGLRNRRALDMLLGMMQAIGAVYMPQLSVLLPFIFMIAILIWKPSGLAGSRT